MHDPHTIALGITLLLLLWQTARAAYYRGALKGECEVSNNLSEEIGETRSQRDQVRKDATAAQQFIQQQFQRLSHQAHAPELAGELSETNGLLRSLHAVTEREGQDTNWPALHERISDALQRQQNLLFTPRD